MIGRTLQQLRIHLWGVFRSVFQLGIGELVSRISSFLLLAYITRRYGVELFGIVTLAQTAAIYVTTGTDQGVRMAGARFVANYPSSASSIIPIVIRRRLISCGVCVLAAVSYAFIGNVPVSARWYIILFALAVIPYAVSLDWLIWGTGRLGWLGASRAVSSVVFTVTAVILCSVTSHTLFSITFANSFGVLSGTALLLYVWRKVSDEFRARGVKVENHEPAGSEQLQWAALLPLGLATILTQAFSNIDVLILAAMVPLAEVGRYNASYKILFMIFGLYYLVTQSLYPRVSRVREDILSPRILLGVIGIAVSIGLILAVLIFFEARPILHFLYGSDMGTVKLLRLLVFAIPLDFGVSLMGIILVGRSQDKTVLCGVVFATTANIGLNLMLIPKLAAEGAAIATLFSYIVLLIILFIGLLRYATRQRTAARVLGAVSE